jgi:hypothetical protein
MEVPTSSGGLRNRLHEHDDDDNDDDDDDIAAFCRSQWPRGLRRKSTAARPLRSWVRIPRGAWMVVCCVLSGRGLCDEMTTRPEQSYRLWRVAVCDQETS